MPQLVKDFGIPGLPVIQPSFYQIVNLPHCSGLGRERWVVCWLIDSHESFGLHFVLFSWLTPKIFSHLALWLSYLLLERSPNDCTLKKSHESLLPENILLCPGVLGAWTPGNYTIMSRNSPIQFILVMALQNGHPWKNRLAELWVFDKHEGKERGCAVELTAFLWGSLPGGFQ